MIMVSSWDTVKRDKAEGKKKKLRKKKNLFKMRIRPAGENLV